jgi:hypothetical protein
MFDLQDRAKARVVVVPTTGNTEDALKAVQAPKSLGTGYPKLGPLG